jgi:LmbE family N-acetylglucosaminyl deacetylase
MTQTTELKPKIVLAVAAHPDDLEVWAGGTIAKFVEGGAAVHFLVLTGGGKGTADRTVSPDNLVATRKFEQLAAAKTLGVSQVNFTAFQDGRLANVPEVQREIVFRIRDLKPDVVIGWDPQFLYSPSLGLINHSDHRAAGQATIDAVYPLSRDHLSFPEHLAQGWDTHKVSTLLLMRPDDANYAVNISKFSELKHKAISEHTSQPDLTELSKALGESEKFMRVDLRF